MLSTCLGLQVSKVSAAAPPSCMCTVGPELIFLGSCGGDSLLLRALPEQQAKAEVRPLPGSAVHRDDNSAAGSQCLHLSPARSVWCKDLHSSVPAHCLLELARSSMTAESRALDSVCLILLDLSMPYI